MLLMVTDQHVPSDQEEKYYCTLVPCTSIKNPVTTSTPTQRKVLSSPSHEAVGTGGALCSEHCHGNRAMEAAPARSGGERNSEPLQIALNRPRPPARFGEREGVRPASSQRSEVN